MYIEVQVLLAASTQKKIKSFWDTEELQGVKA